MALQVGDVCWMKSGGPRMVVGGIRRDDGHVACIWMNQSSDGWKIATHVFNPEVLTDTDPNDQQRVGYGSR